MLVAGNDPLIRTVPVASVRAPPGRPPSPMAAVGEPFARQPRGERLPRSAYALPCDRQRGVAARRGAGRVATDDPTRRRQPPAGSPDRMSPPGGRFSALPVQGVVSPLRQTPRSTSQPTTISR